jgi:hypothetical protein
MARKGGKDRGVVFKKNVWWVRLVHNQRERWHKCDTKSQAKALYQRLRADIREEKFFPEKFTTKQDITLRAWIRRCYEGSTNKNKVGEKVYAKRWSLLLGGRLLSDISTESPPLTGIDEGEDRTQHENEADTTPMARQHDQ